GYRPGRIVDTLGLRAVAEDRVVLSDARDLDRAEAEYLGGAAVRVVPVGSVASVLPDGPLYVHVDLDVVDAEALPGLRFPAGGGPDLAAGFAAGGARCAQVRAAPAVPRSPAQRMRRARALLGVPLMLLSACGSSGAQGQAATSP